MGLNFKNSHAWTAILWPKNWSALAQQPSRSVDLVVAACMPGRRWNEIEGAKLNKEFSGVSVSETL